MATGQHTGAPVEYDLSNRVATAEGTTAARTIRALLGRPRLSDAAGTTEAVLEIDHYATGSGQYYAIDIKNRADNGAAPTPATGAQTAIVIHNYSDRAAAMQIDCTRSTPFLRLKNAENSVNSNGTRGTGAYLDLWGYSTNSPTANLRLAYLNHQLVFQTFDDSRPFIFESQTTAPSLRVNQGNAGRGLYIVQTGAGNAIDVTHQAAAHGVVINPSSAADGFFPLLVNGRRNGAKFAISQDGAAYSALQAQKDGAGAGDAIFIVNKGTGYGIRAQNASADVFRLDAAGMPQIGIGNTAAPPAASSALAGKLWYQGGGAGVKDNVYVCAKDAADAWAWRALY